MSSDGWVRVEVGLLFAAAGGLLIVAASVVTEHQL